MSAEVQKFTIDLLEKKKKELEATELALIVEYDPEDDDETQEVRDLEEKRDKLAEDVEELEEMLAS